MPDGRRLPPVAVDAATSVLPRGDHKSFDIRHKNADGSQIVLSQRFLPNGTKQVTGFKQTEDTRDGTVTRFYADGRRVTQGRDFERRSVGNGPDFVTWHNGLREAVLPDGKPIFEDRFTSFRDRDGRDRRVIERTRYARWWQGRPEYEPRPVVRQYDVGQIHGAPVAQYRPSRFAQDDYRSYYSRFAVPVVVVGSAAAWVAYSSPVTGYNDPVALMGDLQISSGFEEGYAYSMPYGEIPVYDAPEAVALRGQMATVQQQVSSKVQGDTALKNQLGWVDGQAASSQVQQAVGNAVPVQVSEDVRQQVRKQVRLSVAMHQNGRALVLADVLASGYASIYLFQTAQPLNVADVSAGGECFLYTGDLLGFAKLPAGNSSFAEMKVVASGANSCLPGEVVQVRLTDLQEMLNGFSERVEDNMKRVSACAASGRC
ncbi:conserved hypothetical protein [Candidatus Accumulibacter aalborgensis]|uniref:Uncharacterized protein n=1 Tax=Candidatus Accumulibacter aalborgensis TaxID=1860102 RepID=A0A1A8XZZ7_9PROT|nr:conserved hypothetical protein [Candidatus Accumulibacter aalborgensis]